MICCSKVSSRPWRGCLKTKHPGPCGRRRPRALLKLRRQSAGSALTPLIAQADVAPSVRERICLAIAQTRDEDLKPLTRDLFRILPLRHQLTIATRMASSRDEGQMLLDLIVQGIASPRLLQIPIVRDSLQAALGDAAANRIETIVATLSPIDASNQSLLSERIRYYRQSIASVASGREEFKKHCATCHQVSAKARSSVLNWTALGLAESNEFWKMSSRRTAMWMPRFALRSSL